MRCPVLVSPIVSAFLLAGGILPGSGRAAAQSSHDVAAGSLVSVSVDVDGKLKLIPLVSGNGSAHVIVDVTGFFIEVDDGGGG